MEGVGKMTEKLKQLVNGEKKIPRCVEVYDKLFEMIKDGEFVQDSRLPTEPELAKAMGVSRTTLRQALAFLQEDGIIKNVHGKGNFVMKSGIKLEKGLEVLEHPVYSSVTEKIDEVEFEFKIEPSSDYTAKVLERKTPVVIFADRWYKSEGKTVAYTFSIIPVETISEEGIDLSDKNQLLNYLEKTVYEKAKHSSLKINFSEAGNVSAMKYVVSKSERFYLLAETIHVKNKYPVLYNKHYIPMENGYILIDRKAK